jgi:hypothetical protein
MEPIDLVHTIVDDVEVGPNFIQDSFAYTLPAGRYYFGDVGYVFEETDWFAPRFKHGVWRHKDFLLFAMTTSWGDGLYYGSDDFEYGLDTASFGIIPVSLIDESSLQTVKHVSQCKTFASPLVIKIEQGVFSDCDPETPVECTILTVSSDQDWFQIEL